MSTPLRPQRRSRRVAMTDPERDAFLEAERTCRVGTIAPDGPHVTPLWFVWDAKHLWIYSLADSQRWLDLRRDPRVAVMVDAGEEYGELRGVEIRGTAEPVGPVPRKPDEPAAETAAAEQLFGGKYAGGGQMPHDGRHAWLRITPTKITSWDFRKS